MSLGQSRSSIYVSDWLKSLKSPLYIPSILTEYLKLGLSEHLYFFHDFFLFSKFN